MRVARAIAAAALFVCWGQAEAAPPGKAASPCQKHIEISDAKSWAKELGKSEMWVLANHRINLWENPAMPRGNKVGELRVGSRAVIVEELPDSYKVRSPLDRSVGWVSKIQVARTLYQDVNTFKRCTPHGK